MMGLVKIFGGLAGDIIGGVIESKKAKAKQKLVKIEAETEVLQQQTSQYYLAFLYCCAFFLLLWSMLKEALQLLL